MSKKPQNDRVRITRDELWKGVIGSVFEQFFDFFFPQYYPLIDWTKGYELLDKELEQVAIDGKDSLRKADRLVKVYLKKGGEIWILVHIEVQGYIDHSFALRMYTYQYRIFDKFRRPVIALAVYTDDSPSYHPKSYIFNQMGTSITYTFNTYKLLDQSLKSIQAIPNPFSIVMETAWYGLRKNKRKSDDSLLNLKLQLCRKLIKSGYTKEQIRHLFSFIKYYVSFEETDFFDKFDDKLYKNNSNMGVVEIILASAERQGIEKGIELGIEKGVEKGLKQERKQNILNLHRAGFSVVEISKFLVQPKEMVQLIVDDFKKNKDLNKKS